MNREKADRTTKGLYLNIMTSFYEISFGIFKTFAGQKSTNFFAFFPSLLPQGLWSLRSCGVKTKRFDVGSYDSAISLTVVNRGMSGVDLYGGAKPSSVSARRKHHVLRRKK